MVKARRRYRAGEGTGADARLPDSPASLPETRDKGGVMLAASIQRAVQNEIQLTKSTPDS